MADLPSSAHQTIALARLHRASTASVHRTTGGAFRKGHGIRSRVPKQQHPHAIEASFASSIIAHVVDVLRDVMKPITAALAHLLPDDEAARSDADDADVTATELDARAIRFVAGLPIVIENPVGSVRRWVDSDGTDGETTMRHAYGYVAGTTGADGEDIDVYVGRVVDPRVVYVVHQQRKADGFATYDEDKVMIGYPSEASARAAYLEQYNDPRFLGGMTTLTMDEFRARMSRPGTLARDDREDAGDTAAIRRLFDRARAEFEKRALNTSKLDDLVTRFGNSTSVFQRAQLARQVKAALGISLMSSDRNVPELVNRFTHESVTRIRSLGTQSLGDMEKLVAHAFTTGRSSAAVGKDIEDRYGVSERGARFIARDQIGTLTGQVNAARQQAIGITRATWRTVGDERVREEHEALDGEVFDLDDPPASVGLPGEDYNCRCSAEPVFSDILDAIRDE